MNTTLSAYRNLVAITTCSLLLCCAQPSLAKSQQIDITWAAASAKDTSDKQEYGVAIKTRYTRGFANKTLFSLFLNKSKSYKPYVYPELIVAGGWRYSGTIDIDFLLGLSGGLFAFGPVIAPCFIVPITRDVTITLPIIYRVFDGFFSRVEITPYLGYRF